MAKQLQKPEPVERLPLDTRKRCSECGRTKELWEFNPTEANIGRRRSYCKQCEAQLISPKVPPKIVGKGNPIFGFKGMGEIQEQDKKITKPVVIRTPDEVEKIQQEKKKTSRKGKKKTLEWKDKMKKKSDKIQKDALELLKNTIIPYINEHPFAEEHGFQAKDLWQDLKTKYPNNQYFTTLLRRLVKLKKLKVKRQRGSPHIYFLVKDGRIGVAREKVQKNVKLDLDKIEIVNAEGEKMGKKVGRPRKNKAEPVAEEGYNDDFLRGVSTIADEVKINFIERTTEIIISPSGNLLRVYDLLSKEQKENAVVDGKNMKFSW